MVLAHGQPPAQPQLPEALFDWPFEPLVWLALALAAWSYWSLWRRLRTPLAHRATWFYLGLIALGLALASPLATYSEVLFSVHMVQHLLLTFVAAPLLLLGAPLTLLVRAAPRARRALSPYLRSPAVRLLLHPVVSWVLFAAVTWMTHFTPLYNRALESPFVHVLEHALYLVSSLLFWRPVVGLDPGHRLSYPLRLLYLVTALPAQSALGLTIYSTGRVLYPHYDFFRPWDPTALADQQVAAMIMWIGGDLLFVVAIAATVAGWMRYDARDAARIDRRVSETNAPEAPAAGASRR